MLRNASRLLGLAVEATDGEVGSVADLLFDDRQWTVRWAVVDTGGWLADRQVLLAPSMLGEPPALDDERHAAVAFRVALTRRQVEGSPDVSSDEPVSRQHEAELFEHYEHEPYWAGGDPLTVGNPGTSHWPAGDMSTATQAAEHDEHRTGDPHLRSTKDIAGYVVEARDGDIGEVEEFLIDPSAAWAIRYLVVDIGRWLPGRHVLIAPRWLSEIDWQSRSVRVDRCRREIKEAPAYDADAALDRAYEESLHRWYGQPGYWI
jgi:hypothetical protein